MLTLLSLIPHHLMITVSQLPSISKFFEKSVILTDQFIHILKISMYASLSNIWCNCRMDEASINETNC